MKYCLSSRQKHEYLQKADEIKFNYRDRKAIPDFIEKYPEATIILNHSVVDGELEISELKTYNILSHENFIVCCDTISNCKLCLDNDIKTYHSSYAHTFYEVQALRDLGVEYIMVDVPIFFKMDTLRTMGVKLRAVPNLAQKDGLPRKDGVCGSWIRPEDIEIYDDYIAALEFDDLTIDRVKYYQKERAMYRIYAEQKKWPGDLEFLITGLDYPGVNRMIPPAVSRRRLNCGQKCQEFSNCHICYRMLDLANPEKMESYLSDANKDF